MQVKKKKIELINLFQAVCLLIIHGEFYFVEQNKVILSGKNDIQQWKWQNSFRHTKF